MRRKIRVKRDLRPDDKFGSEKVAKFVNYMMLDGKKEVALAVFYDTIDRIKELEKTETPLEIFDIALKNVEPTMEVRSRRVGGANYQVPVEVRPKRREEYSMKWIIQIARAKKGRPMHEKLADEIIAASKNEGDAITKRENVHKMAESNKAFAHFAW